MCGRVTDVPKEDEDMHSEENFREDASGADRDPPTSSHGRMRTLGGGQSPRVGRGLAFSQHSDLVLFWPVGNDERGWREEGRLKITMRACAIGPDLGVA